MKIKTIIYVMILGYSLSYSQTKNTFKIETQGGYEYNYFKSPDVVRVNDTILTKEDLISSSIYQDVSLGYKFRYKQKKNRLRLFIKPSARIFYQNIDDSYWSLDSRLKYDYNLNRRFKVLAEARFKRMNREGLDGDQNVLINPLGYTNYGTTAGIEFIAFKKNEMTFEGFYNFKNFDAFGVRDLQFNEYGAQFLSVQSISINRLVHKIGLHASAKKRLYDTFNSSDTNTDGERDWDYLKGSIFYELPWSEKFKLKPRLTYYSRIDNSTNRSGFNQLTPEIGLYYKSEHTKINASVSYVTRKYKEIEARNTEMRIGEKLKYEYTNFQLNFAHEIRTNISLTATIYSRVRSTNYTDIDARSFRNYRNQYAGIGILWKL